MTTGVATQDTAAELLERVVIGGDLSKLQPGERLQYYREVCASLGLNPLTKPFEYLYLNGKLILYARRDATDQLRKLHEINVDQLEREVTEGVYVVTAHVSNAAGRKDSDLGAVPIDGLKGEARANAMLKAVTKAKRRATLSICGLGMLDETELETIPVTALTPVPPAPAPRPVTPDAVETEPESGRPEVPAAAWELTVADYVDRFDRATSPDEAEGWRLQWLKGPKDTVPVSAQVTVTAAITRARKRLGHGAA